MRRTACILRTTLALFPAVGVRSALPDYPLGDRGLQTRADYFTAGGKYLGGIPAYDDTSAFFNCTHLNFDQAYNSAVSNDTACITWTENVAGSPEHEFGRCACQSVMNVKYCDAWTCSDIEMSSGNEPCPSVDAITSCEVETVLHSTRCVCETEDDSGNFCSSWTCLESDYDYGREFGDYQCARASPTGTYCDAWTGVVENSNEAEISTCECTQASGDSSVCLQWECELRSMTKCSHASPGWCDMGFSVGIGGFLGSFGAVLVALGLFRLVTKGQSIIQFSPWLLILLGIAWMGAWSIGVVIWGGVDGAMCTALWWGAFMVIGVLRGCFSNIF